ncbi:MAG: hypothetical protein GC150_12140 [Rhizobiales bacterium]|nr:hypothetical protein [Hyphomicrobiales bacterium]
MTMTAELGWTALGRAAWPCRRRALAAALTCALLLVAQPRTAHALEDFSLVKPATATAVAPAEPAPAAAREPERAALAVVTLRPSFVPEVAASMRRVSFASLGPTTALASRSDVEVVTEGASPAVVTSHPGAPLEANAAPGIAGRGSEPIDGHPAEEGLERAPAAAPEPAIESVDRMPDDGEVITIVLVGDTGFNAHQAAVRADRTAKHGRTLTWEQTTRYVAPLLTGELAFANIETVVTDRNDLPANPKTFNFRSHPASLEHLARIGFNLFSLANNHAGDYGRRGVLETLRHTEALAPLGVKATPGLGRNHSEAMAPDLFSVGETRFAMSALGIGGAAIASKRGADESPGQLNIHNEHDYHDAIEALAAAPSDYRILSMHYGIELENSPSSFQINRWREETLKARDIDLIVGHHAHVPQGIELTEGKLIFYGLGNFLHPGTANMSGKGRCKDWGILARVHLLRRPDGRVTAEAVEVIPLRDTHLQPRPLSPREAHLRIAALNGMSRHLDRAAAGSRGVRFAALPDGRGLYCRTPSAELPGRLAALCAEHEEALARSKGAIPVAACSGPVRNLPPPSPAVASLTKPSDDVEESASPGRSERATTRPSRAERVTPSERRKSERRARRQREAGTGRRKPNAARGLEGWGGGDPFRASGRLPQ